MTLLASLQRIAPVATVAKRAAAVSAKPALATAAVQQRFSSSGRVEVRERERKREAFFFVGEIGEIHVTHLTPG